jgi:hypothetical protein
MKTVIVTTLLNTRGIPQRWVEVLLDAISAEVADAAN